MKKINYKVLFITCIMCLLPIAFGIVFYDELPENVAIHFDINNNPDGFMPRAFFVFGTPVIMLLFQIFCCIVSDLNDENPEANKKMVIIYKWIIPVITVMMYVVTIMYAIQGALDIRKVVMIILGGLFVIMGNYLPKTVANTQINFPKIKNEKVYAKTKRIFGYVLIVDGLLFIASTLFNAMVSVGLVGVVILEAIILTVYAMVQNRKGI